MFHEKFRSFKVSADNLNDPELLKFLNRPDISPKSISVVDYEAAYSKNKKIVLIGYDQTEDLNSYILMQREIPDVAYHGLHHLDSMIESQANAIGGVVCQDFEYADDNFYFVFLTTVKP